jgi:siroheme synthase (precorrin-2 oxidase/ferrochelatase)
MNSMISINLTGKHVLVAGGDFNCAEMLQKLKSAGANVTLVDPETYQ